MRPDEELAENQTIPRWGGPAGPAGIGGGKAS